MESEGAGRDKHISMFMDQWKYIEDVEEFIQHWMCEDDWVDRVFILEELWELSKRTGIGDIKVVIEVLLRVWDELREEERKSEQIKTQAEYQSALLLNFDRLSLLVKYKTM